MYQLTKTSTLNEGKTYSWYICWYYPWYLLSGPDPVLDLNGAGIWELRGEDFNLWSLSTFLAESILFFISCLRHKKIQRLANFEPQTCRFTRIMTLYTSADVFFIYTLYYDHEEKVKSLKEYFRRIHKCFNKKNRKINHESMK